MVSIDTEYDLTYVDTEIDLNRRNEIHSNLQRKRKVPYKRNHCSKKEIKMKKNTKQKIAMRRTRTKFSIRKRSIIRKMLMP